MCIYVNKESIVGVSYPFAHLSACSFSLTVEPIWIKFKDFAPSTPGIPQF